MSKAAKIERRWRQGASKDVSEADMLLVLEANGFRMRRDRGNHWLAEHRLLAEHPQFGLSGPVGRVKINCHYRGQAGKVHPAAVKDVLRALDWIRSVEGETE